MESLGSIKLFGQVIFVDAQDHGDHEKPIEAETGEDVELKEDEKKGEGATGCKPPRKPDKILPCPRCSSMDTKFCYFNNYNVNQPRHFCRNCQRYWTAGGTMRNVPVGAGRRKSKSCSGGSRHVTLSEATLRAVELACREPARAGSLAFPGDGSAAGDEAKTKQLVKEICNSSTVEKNKEARHGPVNSVCQVHALQVPYFDGSTWLYQWNPTPVGFHLVPPCWGAAAPSPPSAESAAAPPSPLGKHARGGDILKQSNNSDVSAANEPVSIPKSMKIDDADEVARSSMWTTVGIKRDKAGGITKGGLFGAFHQKEESSSDAELAAILSANPAAMARSLNYRESAA